MSLNLLMLVVQQMLDLLYARKEVNTERSGVANFETWK